MINGSLKLSVRKVTIAYKTLFYLENNNLKMAFLKQNLTNCFGGKIEMLSGGR